MMDTENRKAPKRRVCIFSQRGIRQDVSRCSGFEFEDVVAEMEDCSIAVAQWRRSRSLDSLQYRARRFLSKKTDLFRYAPSGTAKQPLTENFDVFACFVQKPVELLTLDAIPNWREKSNLAVCILEEVWDVNLAEFAPLVRSLSKFDLITSAFASVCQDLSRLTGRPVIHLPGAADLTRFAPKNQAERAIDVYYLGRKRSDLHQALQRVLDARAGFYLYDSATKMPIAADHVAHRQLLASLVQRSKLFVVDYAKFGHADQNSGQISWGPRYVEGLAGGAIPIGYAPKSKDFLQNFDWPEAVFRLPDDPSKAAKAVAQLLDDPGKINKMRSVNLGRVAQKHDWLHRWELILNHFGLPLSKEMLTRQKTLIEISKRKLCQTMSVKNAN